MGSEAQQYPWQIRAIQYAARLPQLVLVWRGASAYPARPFADYPRVVLGGAGTQRPISPSCRSDHRKATATLPRRRDSSEMVPAELMGPSALARRPARLASGQFGRTAQHP